ALARARARTLRRAAAMETPDPRRRARMARALARLERQSEFALPLLAAEDAPGTGGLQRLRGILARLDDLDRIDPPADAAGRAALERQIAGHWHEARAAWRDLRAAPEFRAA
ncbi:hypothetical protein, partial [Mangrovicoccus algicola]